MPKQGTVTTMETRAIGKRAAPDVSGDASTPRVSHPPGIATTPVEMAAGNTIHETVHQAPQGHDMGLTPPAFAEGIDEAAGHHVTPVAPDDARYGGHPKDAEVARAAIPKPLSQLFALLEALATFPEREQLLLDMPPDCYDRLDHYLNTAFATLNRLRTFRKEHQHDATEVLVQPRAPQRVRQPTKGKTRRKTKQAQKHAALKAKPRKPAQTAHTTTETAPSQPDLLLAVINTAPQQLTREDLRQSPGVDGSRLKRNLARLVAQGKIQEMPGGTFCGVR
jgi:hypothetical protein